MLNLITVAAVLLLFCRSYSTALNCPSVSVCEEDATMFNNGFSGSTRAGDKHKEPPTFTVEKFIGTIGSPWKNEFKVTMNWKNQHTDISAVYLQVCNWNREHKTRSLNETEFVLIDVHYWKLSSCPQENDAALFTKLGNRNFNDLSTIVSLPVFSDVKLRSFAEDSVHTMHGPIDVHLYDKGGHNGPPNLSERKAHEKLVKRETQQTSDYIIVANELYLHQLSLDGSRVKTLASGLGNARAIDYDLRLGFIYWTDVTKQSIFRSNLDGTNVATILGQGLQEPAGIAVDWINNKLYWSDVQTRWIGVMDLNTRCYKMLLATETDASPREIVVDPTRRILYWAEWGSNARIKSSSMDGFGITTIHSTDLVRPYAVTLDIETQSLYWADNILDKVETSSVNGVGRQTITTTAVPQVFSITVFGNNLYLSDWTFGVRRLNISGGEAPVTIFDNFCDFIYPYGIKVVSRQRQIYVDNPCETNNGGCSHFCLLSAVDSKNYSCACPSGMNFVNDTLNCFLVNETNSESEDRANMTGSCRRAGYMDCCSEERCTGDSGDCFCDVDCHLYNDCCEDLSEICLLSDNTSSHLVFSNSLYIQRLSLDGTRTKNIHSGLNSAIGIDYHYRSDHLYWSVSNELWRSQLDGSQALLLLNSNISVVDDIAVDWISDKLYWTDNGFDRIGVFDLTSGYFSILINTGVDSSPRGIITDPLNRLLYWCDWGAVAKIETASMDGTGRSVIHDTGLVWPNGLTLDHTAQVMYWIDANHDRIESSFVNGSNRIVVTSSGISRPFSITLFRDKLFFTDRRTIRSVPKTGGTVQTINNLCEVASGIEVIAEERQPRGTNLCGSDNGGCAHICLLSSTDLRDYACACHIGFTLDSDMANCSSGSEVDPEIQITSHGTCAAANYSGCCRSGLCRGSPPTCSCDPLCSIFQDCCIDFSPCPLDSVTVSTLPGNTTLILTGGQHIFQFRCEVESTDTTSVHWTFTSTFTSVTRRISDATGSLNLSLYAVTLRQDQPSGSNLTINNVWFLDDGIYTCSATTGEFSDQASSRLTILVAPSTPVISGNTSYSEANEAVLECTVSTYPSPTIVWVKRDTNIGSVILNSQRTSISFNFNLVSEPTATSRLRISRLTSSDNGTYSCQVFTEIPGYSTVSSHYSISVEEIDECQTSSPCQNGGSCSDLVNGYSCSCTNLYTGQNCTQEIGDVPQMQPNLTETPMSMEASIASPVNLTCSAEGYPPPTYQWYKDGVAVLGATQSFLYIPELLPDDRGAYVCRANNTVGQMTSDYARVDISGVHQYLATLTLNASTTTQAFEEALDAITDPSSMESNTAIYALQIVNTTTSGEAVFLVTTINGINNNSSTLLRLFIQTVLERIPAVLFVTSLVRYDGCQSDRVDDVEWLESNIGETIQLPCPCEDFLQSGKLASRTCGGSYSQGGQWMDVDYTQCDSIANEVTNALCSIALSSNSGAEVRSEAIVNITSEPQNFTADDVSITTFVIQELTKDAIVNPEVRENYLTAIDNLQRVDRDVILTSEVQNRSSSRVLESLGRFLDDVDINLINTTSNTTMFSYRTFALQVQNIDISSLNGQTFNVDLRSVEEARNMTGDIDDSNLITQENVMEALSNATAAIHISEELLNHCTPGLTNQRLSYSVFLFDSFFLSQNPNETIGSLIIAARLKCGSNTTVPPINFTLLSSNDVNASQGACARWNSSNEGKFGTWSRSGCREITIEGNKRMCQCSQLGHFGILFDLNPSQLPGPLPIIFSAISYIGTVVSLICLLIFNFSYLAIKKLRTSTHGQILLSMSFSLIGLYVIFIVSGQVTLIPPLCGISSALLHYFLLVFFAWTAVEAVWLYLKLVKIFGVQSIERRFFMVSSLLSWLVPLLVVLLSSGAGYQYYTSEFYCRATEWPFWFGLILPLLVVYIFNWIMFTIIIISICKHMKSISKKTSGGRDGKDERKFNTKNFIVAIGLSITFGLGWGFGFLATSHDIIALVIIFQGIFTVVAGIQGVLLFIFHGVRNQEVQTLWKSMLFALSRKTRKVYSLTQSTTETKTSKRTTMTPSASADCMLSSHSTAVKSSSMTFSDHSVGTVDTNIDFEPNPAYGGVKRDEHVIVNENVAYNMFKKDGSNENNAYETVKQDLSDKDNAYETVKQDSSVKRNAYENVKQDLSELNVLYDTVK